MTYHLEALISGTWERLGDLTHGVRHDRMDAEWHAKRLEEDSERFGKRVLVRVVETEG